MDLKSTHKFNPETTLVVKWGDTDFTEYDTSVVPFRIFKGIDNRVGWSYTEITSIDYFDEHPAHATIIWQKDEEPEDVSRHLDDLKQGVSIEPSSDSDLPMHVQLLADGYLTVGITGHMNGIDLSKSDQIALRDILNNLCPVE